MTTEESEGIWYFAIGSMMNPVSLAGRNIKPIRSIPGEILDFELGFFSGAGMAEACPSLHKSFHGVLHLLTPSDMKELDKIEVAYIRTECRVKLYDDTILEKCYVYCKDQSKVHVESNSYPSERYLTLLLDGCKYYGVKQSHIDYLQSLPYIPRKHPSEFSKLEISEDLLTWTMDDIKRGDGQNGNPCYFSLNGKVYEYIGKDKDYILHNVYSQMVPGKNMEVVYSKMLYDPKYGMHDKIEEFTREHCAYIEDFQYPRVVSSPEKFRLVALFDQIYAD